VTIYSLLKALHVIAVAIFFGNITVGIFWKAFADRTKDPRIIAHTLAGIIRADRLFTIPAVIVLVLAGLAAAGVGHIPILSTGWVLWPVIIFILTGIAFGPVSRSQRELRDIAQSAVGGTMDWQAYAAADRRWTIFGMIATILPLIAIVIMVTKPVLPAFHH